jgi:hypothetical protein
VAEQELAKPDIRSPFGQRGGKAMMQRMHTDPVDLPLRLDCGTAKGVEHWLINRLDARILETTTSRALPAASRRRYSCKSVRSDQTVSRASPSFICTTVDRGYTVCMTSQTATE